MPGAGVYNSKESAGDLGWSYTLGPCPALIQPDSGQPLRLEGGLLFLCPRSDPGKGPVEAQ